MPDQKVKVFEEFKLQKKSEINSARQKFYGASWNDVWATVSMLALACPNGKL